MGRCAVISYVPEKRNYQDHSYRRKIGKGDRFGSWAAILCMPAVSVFIVTAFFFWDSRATLNNFALAAGALILCGSILHANGEWQEYFVVESYLTWYPLVEKNVEGVFLKGGQGRTIYSRHCSEALDYQSECWDFLSCSSLGKSIFLWRSPSASFLLSQGLLSGP